MKKNIFFLMSFIALTCCKKIDTKQFSSEALNAPIININGQENSLKNTLQKYSGKTTLIDVWAGWCSDCIKNMPKIKNLQEKYPNVNYVFISLDKNQSAWKESIKRFSIKGNHYYVNGGWKSIFAKNVDLDWIPRYIVLDKNGKVALYKAIEADDPEIINLLKN